MDLTAGAFQHAADHAAPRAVHRIHHDVLRILRDHVEIDQLAQMGMVLGDGIEARDQAFLARHIVIDQVGAASLGFVIVQVNFHFSA